MVNLDLLKKKIEKSGLKVSYIAEQCGLSYPVFWNRVSGRTPFRVSEIKVLKSLLRLSPAELERIFFADDVEVKSTKKGA